MDNDSQFDENDFSIDIINNCEELEEEKTTSIKSNDNKACDDINKDKKVIKEENIKEKSKIPFLEEKKEKKDESTQTKKSNLDDDDEYSDEDNNADSNSLINKKRKREYDDDEGIPFIESL